MFEIILGIVTILLNFYLGLFVFFRNTKSWTSRLFLALTLFINGYVITNYLSLHPPINSPQNQLMWIRIVMAEASFIGPTLLILVHTFPGDKIRLSLWKLYLLGILCVSSFILSLSPFLFTSIEYPNGQPVPVPGPAIPVFFFDFVGLFIVSFILLIYKYIKSSGIERVQHWFFLIGTITTFSLMALSTVVLVVIFKFSGLVFLGPSYTLFLVAFIAYAIIRHRFLDIRLIVARTVTYSILLFAAPTVYILAAFIIGSWLLRLKISVPSLVFFAILTVLLAFSFERMKRILQKTTDRVFFMGHYDQNVLLTQLGHIMSSDIQLDSLAKKILMTITEQLRVSKGAFILFENNVVYDVIQVGFENKLIFKYENYIALLKSGDFILFDELEESPMKQLLREMDAYLVRVLKANDKIVGLFVLGPKSSGDIFSEGDIKFIDIFAPEVAVAIQNAQSFDQIRKFNVTLTQEVEKATRDLKVANFKLQQLDKLKDDFVSMASHELRTPMTAIRSYVWMALHKSDMPLTQKMQKYLYRTLVSTERLINLVNDMLNISRIESGRVQITPKLLDLQQLTQEVLSEVDIKAREKNVKVQMTPDANLPKAFADPDKVHQVMLNLLGNSLKFTPSGGLITVFFFSDGTQVDTVIKDTGVGISKEEQGQLFTKFGRLDSSYQAAASSGGTGLGLYICKSLVEMMKGKIWVSSEGQGKGTSFTFSLPIASQEVLKNPKLYEYNPGGEAKGLEPVAI